MNWYLAALKKYAVFSGRSRRKEFWFFCLFNIIIAFILGIIDGILATAGPEGGIGLLGGLYSLAVLIPGLAVTVRRLHDTDRTGWWILISLVPIVGAIILLVFLVLDSNPQQNKYGPSPKAAAATAAPAPEQPAAPAPEQPAAPAEPETPSGPEGS